MKHIVYLEDVCDLLDEYIRVYTALSQSDIADKFKLFQHAVGCRIPVIGTIDTPESL